MILLHFLRGTCQQYIVSEEEILTASPVYNPSNDTGDAFGTAVAVDGSLAIVGAEENDERGVNAGAVYGFVVSTFPDPLGSLSCEYLAPGPNYGFGAAVDISNGWAVVGASLNRSAVIMKVRYCLFFCCCFVLLLFSRCLPPLYES